MSTKFEEASKLWGREKLRNAGITANEVTSVYFEVDHGDCCRCSGNEYCYCLKDDDVYVNINYTVAGIAQSRNLSFTHDLGNLLREVTDW